MIVIEVFRKKKKMEPILNRCWSRLTNDMPYPAVADEDPVQKLVYFGLIAYATVYEAAIAAGMSSSAAHYLARLQLGKCKLGQPVTNVVEATFSGFDSEEKRQYAAVFHTHIGQAIEKILAGSDDIDALQTELAGHFKPAVGIVAEE
jgi:hypothetical protein